MSRRRPPLPLDDAPAVDPHRIGAVPAGRPVHLEFTSLPSSSASSEIRPLPFFHVGHYSASVPSGTARHAQAVVGSCQCRRFGTAALGSTTRWAAGPHRAGPHRAGPSHARASAGPGGPFGHLYSTPPPNPPRAIPITPGSYAPAPNAAPHLLSPASPLHFPPTAPHLPTTATPPTSIKMQSPPLAPPQLPQYPDAPTLRELGVAPFDRMAGTRRQWSCA
jgi:hypothetical protein